MKKTFKAALIFALLAAFAACTATAQSITSPEALKQYLDRQPANSPDKPIRVSMGANEPMLPNIVRTINSAGKYVSLELTGSALTAIPDWAFEGCKTLVGITIPNSITSIGYNAFDSCTSLASVTIGNGVKSIEDNAFDDCTSLASITVSSGNPNYVSEAGILYNKAKTEIVHVPRRISGNVTIPNSVTSIGHWAFFRCTSLASITIPNSVTSIGGGAFQRCDSLTSVTFQGTIDSSNFGAKITPTFPGDLQAKYFAGGPGTYKTTNPGDKAIWTKQ